MQFIDWMDDKFIEFRSPFMKRMNDVPVKYLKKHSEIYDELDKNKDKILEKYSFINDLIEGNNPDKEVYTKDDMRALKDFLECARKLDDYERLEIYKMGLHDCIEWMKMINVL